MKKSLASVALLALTLILSGCGQGTTSPSSEPTPAASGAANVTVTGNDQMKYDKTSFTVKPGQKVKLTLKNVGKMPKMAMGHNLIILKLGEDYKAFDAAAAPPKGTPENNYLPEDLLSKVIAHTKLLGPGESDTIEFTAPSEAGDYPFLCTFPGHAVAGMRGNMIVK